MAIATIKYDLNNQDDVMLFKQTMQSSSMASALWEILKNAEKRCEHIAETLEADSDKHDGIYVAFQEVRRICGEHNIDIDQLIV